MTGDRAQAEDLAQETFVKAFRNLKSFDPTRRLSSWLFRIAHNTALDALRRLKPEISSSTGCATAIRSAIPPAPDQPDGLEQAALGAALEPALLDLRPGYRAAIALRYDQQLPFEEIGQDSRRARGHRPHLRPPRPQGLARSLSASAGRRRDDRPGALQRNRASGAVSLERP